MDITANLVTPQQLSTYMDQLHAAGATTATGAAANQDQWCYALSAITGTPCPAYDIGNGPTVMTSAQVFLDGLRNWQLSRNASSQGPGGTSTTASGPQPAPATGSGSTGPAAAPQAAGIGLLGPTNCQFCIWLKANPWALALIAVGLYFAFVYKPGKLIP